MNVTLELTRPISAALLTILITATLFGCGDDQGVVCAQNVSPGLQVEVRDSIGRQAAAEGSFGTAREGYFLDTLRVALLSVAQPPLYLLGADGRPGVYDVTVRKTGFLDWRASGVVVESTGPPCPGVRTVHLQANLQPAP